MLRIAKWVMLASLALVFAPRASSQCLPLVCSISMQFASDPSGISLGGSGTNSASMAFGAVQAYGGSVPPGVTKTTGATTWTLSTPFDVKVFCLNAGLLPCTLLMTPTYTLTAQLQTNDLTNTWKLNGTQIISTGATTLTSNGAYCTSLSCSGTAYTFALSIPYTETAGPISNTINFVAISN